MLWRTGYSTRELGPVPLPELDATALSGNCLDPGKRFVLIGGFDLAAQAELGVWRRLLTEFDGDLDWRAVFLLEILDKKAGSAVQAMTPPSLWDRVALAACTPDWFDLVEPDRPTRSFAGIVSAGTIDPLMIGLPTEEAWDRFRNRL